MLRETTMMEFEGDSTQEILRNVIYNIQQENRRGWLRVCSVLTSSFPLENNVSIAFYLFLEKIYSRPMHRRIKGAATWPKNQLNFSTRSWKIRSLKTRQSRQCPLFVTLCFSSNITYWKYRWSSHCPQESTVFGRNSVSILTWQAEKSKFQLRKAEKT